LSPWDHVFYRAKPPPEIKGYGEISESLDTEVERGKGKSMQGGVFWLLAFGFWLLAFGFWLLAFGFWLLAFGF
jgi:hypothetical protein